MLEQSFRSFRRFFVLARDAADERAFAALPLLRRRRSALLLLLGAAAIFACSSLSPEAQRVARGFIGADVAVVRKCLGDALYLDIREDGSELWGFAFGTPEVGNDIAIRRVTGQATAYARPAIETGTPTERRNAGTGAERLLTDRIDAGQCLHIFAMVDGHVQSYVARGRNASGLNADSLCVSLLEPCIDGLERGEQRIEARRRNREEAKQKAKEIVRKKIESGELESGELDSEELESNER